MLEVYFCENRNFIYLLCLDIGIFIILLITIKYIYSCKLKKSFYQKVENLEYGKEYFIETINDIGKFIECEDFNSLKEFYKKSISECNDNSDLNLLNNNIINESAIYNIVYNKYYLAKKENIKVELEINLDFSKVKIRSYELAKILGILLDNAIEATRECKDKIIYISFLSKENKDIVKISNTYNTEKQIDMNRIFTKGYSLKKKNSGLGLWEVRQILLKHSNLDLYTNKIGNLFIQELAIYYK